MLPVGPEALSGRKERKGHVPFRSSVKDTPETKVLHLQVLHIWQRFGTQCSISSLMLYSFTQITPPSAPREEKGKGKKEIIIRLLWRGEYVVTCRDEWETTTKSEFFLASSQPWSVHCWERFLWDSCTFIDVPGRLTGPPAAVWAALLVRGAVIVALATLHARGSKSGRSIRSWTRPLLYRFHREEKLAAHHTLWLFIREDRL